MILADSFIDGRVIIVAVVASVIAVGLILLWYVINPKQRP